jgi:hypothetical protein
MNRISKLAVAAAFASFSFAGVSFADSLEMNWPAQLEKTVSTFDSNFNIAYSDQFNTEKGNTNPNALPLPGEGVAKLQAAIRGNKQLTDKLAAKDIKVDDVINAEQAADGSITFYVR